MNVPGAVQFTKGRMTGTGVGATYDRAATCCGCSTKRSIIGHAGRRRRQGAVEATAKAAAWRATSTTSG